MNGNELVNFNLVQKKIIRFIKNILEVRASVIITDGTICTTVFVTYSQIQYNSTIFFNYCMVLYCTHRSLGSQTTIIALSRNIERNQVRDNCSGLALEIKDLNIKISEMEKQLVRWRTKN